MEESTTTTAAATAASSAGPTKKSPSDFLKQVLGKPVIVQLNSGVTYRGILACLDGFMNIAMEQTEEYVDGQLKNRYGDCFIRGNNGASRGSSLKSSLLSRTVSRPPPPLPSTVHQHTEGKETIAAGLHVVCVVVNRR